MVVQPVKIQKFLAHFKKYRMTKEEIMHLCLNSHGLLASKVSNFTGLFDTLKIMGINAKDTRKIIRLLPEFALQNRKDLIRRKVELIQRESGRDDIYIRNFVKRHPDVLMKSMGSLEAKIAYF